jgi:hypothetical protein
MWSADSSWQCIRAGVRGGEVARPEPSLTDAQVGPTGGPDDAGGDVQQQAIAQLLRLRDRVFAVEEQGTRPGDQVYADQGELEPGGIDGELSRL